APGGRAPVLEDVGTPLRDARMWLLAGGSSLYLVAQIAITNFVVLFLHQHRGLSAHAAAGVLAGINVLGLGARLGAGRWSDRVRARGARAAARRRGPAAGGGTYRSRAKTRNVGDPAGSSLNSGLTQPSSPVRCS